MKFISQWLMACAVLSCSLAGCGGGSSAPPATSPPATSPPVVAPPTVEPPVVTPPVVTPPIAPDWYTLYNHCARPRSGDTQGTLNDELRWVHSYVNESYLWYKELPTNLNMADYADPLAYFAVMKTSAITPSGRAKDRFHFTYPTDVWEAMSGAGVELTYGVTWSHSAAGVLPRVWRVAMVEPGSPAALAGVQRGDALVSIDGADLQTNSSATLAILNAGLSPKTAGEPHQFVLTRNGQQVRVTLTSATLALSPVQNAQLLQTASGTVGYLQFHDHNAVAERQLADAFDRFKSANVSDLILDMRYNGGGYVVLAAELAYMIAGPDTSAGKVFEQMRRNDKWPQMAPQMFDGTAAGLSPARMKRGTPLPSLGLKRVTMLTTPGTCSASESVINGLRGIDIEVTLIGGETCGKPYAFTPTPNCGTTYFSIEMQGTNHKGYGDYADGFQPTCNVNDDLTHEMGDSAEGMLAAALSYRANGVCPATPQRNRSAAGKAPEGALQVERPPGKQIGIYLR